MSFLLLDDNFPDHPKVEILSDKAFRLHVAGLAHCAKHLTDGKVASGRVPKLVGYSRKALTELLEIGLWHPTQGGYEIHDYLDWNMSRAQVNEKRAQATERQRKWREKKQRDDERNALRDALVTEPTPLHSTVSSPSDRDNNHLALVTR